MATIDQEITLLTTELLDALASWRTARTTVTALRLDRHDTQREGA